jgi:hypothetical protein
VSKEIHKNTYENMHENKSARFVKEEGAEGAAPVVINYKYTYPYKYL